jgi:hypothetical protein
LKTNRFIILSDAKSKDIQAASTSRLKEVCPPKREEMSKAELKIEEEEGKKNSRRGSTKISNPDKFNGFNTSKFHEFTSYECSYDAFIEAMCKVSRDD